MSYSKDAITKTTWTDYLRNFMKHDKMEPCHFLLKPSAAHHMATKLPNVLDNDHNTMPKS